MRRLTFLSWLFIFIVLLPGSLAPAAAAIKVEKIGQADFETLLKSHKNRVVLVNVWATWCKPCREEFPDLVKLQDAYKGKDVQVISISADYPDEIDSKILPFLKKFRMNFPVYVQNFPKADVFIDYMNPKWNGALPATFIYDKTGEQKTFFIGKRDLESFRREIEKVRR